MTANLTPVLTDAPTLRARVHAKTIAALQSAFPLDLKGRTLELKDAHVRAADFSPERQKKALMEGASLEEVVKGTLVLRGADGKVVDEARDFTLVHLPYFTERHTLVAGGNEYQVANMLRRRPGVYTTRRENGELATTFNLSKGQNFSLALNPEKGAILATYGTTNLPVYAMLRALGTSHDEIAKHLGAGVADANAKLFDHRVPAVVDKLYAKLVHPLSQKPGATHDEKLAAVREKFAQTAMDAEVTKHTLGAAHASVTPAALLAASKKILDVHNGRAEVDDADSLAFKTFHSVDDFLAERLRLTAREWKNKARYALHGKDEIRKALRPAPFSDSVRKFITTSPLTAVPTGINPIELLDHAVKVTALGEGGIPSERAIPESARLTHPTHYGTLDPIRTPESGHAGVDLRATISAHRDEQGNLYTPVLDAKTGKKTYMRSGDLMHKVVAFPHQKLVGTVDAFVNGQVKKVPASEVQYQFPTEAYTLSPSTALIPMLHNIQGNRAIMGAKMQTQGLPLVHREAPLVQVKSHLGSRSFEDVFGHLVVPTAPVHGTVEKVQDGYIYIRPEATKKAGDGAIWANHAALNTGEVGRAAGELADDPARDAHAATVRQRLRRLAVKAILGVVPPHLTREPEELPEFEHGEMGDWYRHGLAPWEHARPAKTAADRPVIEKKPLGPFIFHIEIKKGTAHKAEGLAKARGSSEDYGHLPGYVGPDGDSLDFFVGNDPQGHIFSYEKQKRPDPKSPWKTTDVKFVVGLNKADTDRFERNTNEWNSETVRFANRRTFKDWDHLRQHIDEHHKYAEEKCATCEDHDAEDLDAWTYEEEGSDKTALDLKPWIAGAGMLLSSETAPAPPPRVQPQMASVSAPLGPQLGKRIAGGFVRRKLGAAKADTKDDGLIRIPYQQNFPFPSKTYLHHDLKVAPGDRVSAGQKLADSNFTRDGTLALGVNLRVAYMPYHGLNSNDAVVISEGAARRLTSEHMYREVYPLTGAIELGREKHRAAFGVKYTPARYAALDEQGVVKKGAKVNPKDLLVVGVVKNTVQGADALFGRISKSLVRPYREVVLAWEHGVPGEVVDVVKTDRQIAILVKTLEPMQVGDKLSGRYGNKGVVAKIVPDAEMVRDEKGNVVDAVYTSAGVVSRINPAQIIETAVAKVAEKTGKPIVYDNASDHNAVTWAKGLLKTHGLKDREHLYDPAYGRVITGPEGKGILVGPQFTFKLFKSTETNFSGHAVGPYDVNQQPVKVGGEDSAKGIGKMELDALLAHNARNVIAEAANVRGQRNDEFWRALQLGLPLPAAKPSFAFNKFTAMLEGAGVKVDKRGSKFKLLPLTDHDIAKRSSGEIKNGKTLVAKNLAPEKGGLFDPAVTGGPQGALYSHIALPEPVVNPVFAEPVRRLLGMTEKAFEQAHAERGGDWIRAELARIDVGARVKALRERMRHATGAELNDVVKQIKYLEALKAEGLKPHDAYVLTKVPVIPPAFRPIVAMPNDPSQLMVADANKLYANLMDVAHAVKTNVVPSAAPTYRGALYKAVGAVFGTHDVEDDELKGQNVKGFLTQISGKGSPKGGFFQRKLMFRPQDVSGRGTIVPDGNLGMDEIGLPEDMLWKMLDKLIVARLVRSGYDPVHARGQVDQRTAAARDAMMAEVRERPFIFNRAPTLHRYSMVAAYAKPVQGKTIRMNPFAEVGLNADYDGDTLQIHAPIEAPAVEDAKKMLLSNLLLSDQQPNQLMVAPRMEAIMGITAAAAATPNAAKAPRVFDGEHAVLTAYRKGELRLDDPIRVRPAKTAAEDDDGPFVRAEPAWTTESALAAYPLDELSGEDE